MDIFGIIRVDMKPSLWDVVRRVDAICTENADDLCAPNAECFRSISVPNMSIDNYWIRIVDNFYCEPNTFLIALVYIERLNKHIPIKHNNVHRILLVACVLARKYHEDDGYTNAHYAIIGGLCTKELCLLEMYFCKLIGYKLFVKSLA